MYFPLLISVLFSFVVIQSHSTNALKCFKCKSEDDCHIYYNFRSDFQEKDSKHVDEECTSSNYISACQYVIDKEYAVRERGCARVGVTTQESFCTNRLKDVLVCYCTTDWCNGIDTAGSAVNVAKEHFRKQDEDENTSKSDAVVNGTTTLATLLSALIMVSNSICG